MGCCCCCKGLGCVGVLWMFLNFLSTAISCFGFYFPYWIQGIMRGTTPAYLGIWRRCNYLKAANDSIDIILECGRYSSFLDIPSIWWQIGTVSIGTGCGLLLLVTFFTIFGCCCHGVISQHSARICAFLQLFAAVLLGAGLALYPLGWKSTEVRLLCGPRADVYNPGNCQILWAFWLAVSGAGLTLFCSLLGCYASPSSHKPSHTTRQSRDNYINLSTQ